MRNRSATAAATARVIPSAMGVVGPMAIMGFVILLIFAARVRLLEVPLERDEGEYAYMGQLMLDGIAPYSIAANMKFPGASAVYAIVMAILGQSTTAIHVGLLLANTATVWFLFLIGRSIFFPLAGVAAAASYSVLSSGWSVMGVWAHATHFVVLPAVAGTYLLLRWAASRKVTGLFWSGILFGICILMKQHGVFFPIFAGAYILHQRRWKDAALFAGAVLLPFLLMCVLLFRAGVIDKFWFWTITYAREYATATSLSTGVRMFTESISYITLANWPVWLIAIAGAALLFREKRWFVLALLLAGFLAVCPGFYFRDHYFILVLPAVALCAAAAARPGWPVWAVSAVLVYCIFQQREFLFEAPPAVVAGAVYGANPFPEAQEIAKYIRANSAPTDKVAVLGSEPEIFFHAHRQSATPYIYVYPLMETHPFARTMQEEFVRDLESAKPRYVVMVNVPLSWGLTKESPTVLLDWWAQTGIRQYRQVGIADILPKGTVYRWDAAFQPQSANHIQLLQRVE